MSGEAPTATLKGVASRRAAVSVVIPSRDGTETIRRAVGSLLRNAHCIREVIVVFSCSPEQFKADCPGMLAEFTPSLALRFFDSGDHSNGSIARNAGIDAACGEYIAFLDDDDEWFDDKLDEYFTFLEAEKLIGDFVLFSQVVSCKEDRTEWSLFPSTPYDTQPMDEFVLSHGGGVQTSALLLPSGLAQRVRFDPGLIRHQDCDFCIRLAERGASFHFLPRPLSYWYQRGDNTAKGNTFDYCSRWLLANRPRLSSRAVAGYVGKELFATVRASRQWRRLGGFMWRHLSLRESLTVLAGLVSRSVAKVLGRSPSSRSKPYPL